MNHKTGKLLSEAVLGRGLIPIEDKFKSHKAFFFSRLPRYDPPRLNINLVKVHIKGKYWASWKRAFESKLKTRDRLRFFCDTIQSKLDCKLQRDRHFVFDCLAGNVRLWRGRKDVLLRLEERLDFFRTKAFRLLHAFTARARRSLVVLTNVFNRK